jgi:predicted DNA-binding transcriptional regulator AlpA
VAGELVGTTDVAAMLGVSRQRVSQLIDSYEDFPVPVDVIAGRRVWTRDEVQRWIAEHPTRPPGRPSGQAGEQEGE